MTGKVSHMNRKKEQPEAAGTEPAPDPREAIRGGEPPEGGEEHLEEGTQLGAVQIHNNVIATIARLAALKVPGVVEMSGTFVDGLAGMIGKKAVDRGIHVVVEDNAVVMELHVVLEFGVRIPQVAWQIQNEVRQAVEHMTGKVVKAVNVIVQTLRFPGENKPVSEEGGGL
jgi:uncharacterized alkaline shock family protein YloU